MVALRYIGQVSDLRLFWPSKENILPRLWQKAAWLLPNVGCRSEHEHCTRNRGSWQDGVVLVGVADARGRQTLKTFHASQM